MGVCADKPKLFKGDYEIGKRSISRKTSETRLKTHGDSNGEDQQDVYQQRNRVRTQTQVELKKTIFQLFDVYDTNHDGFLDKREVEKMLDNMYARTNDEKLKITKKHVIQFFKSADKSEDQIISKQQLYHFYKAQA